MSVGNTAFLTQPPPLRGTSFHRKEGVSTRAPSLGRGCRAQRGGVGFFFAAKPPPLCLPHWGKGTASTALGCSRIMAHLRQSSSLFFIPLVPYPARFARHLPHAGKALSVRNTAFLTQPPPLRGTSFHRKEGVSTRAPSYGRGCRAQRGGVGFFFAAKPPPLYLPHWGKGTASAALRCSRIMAHLRRSSSLFFIPLVPYPARSARHLPHAGKALLRDSSIYKIWKTCKPLNL